MDENFSKYSTEDGITADDTLIIANLIKKKKIKDPEKLNKLAKNNPNEFIEEVKKTAEKGRKEDQELKEKVEILLTRFERMFPKSELPETEPESKFEETAVNRNKLEIPLAIISLSFLSFLLWTFERIFDIDLSSVLNNYFLIKLLLQIMLITSALALIKREKKFWWSTFIGFIIAIFTLIKK